MKNGKEVDLRNGIRHVIRAEHLVKNFKLETGVPGKKTRLSAVNDVTFELLKGEVLSLLGESGCGKSTLARMLMHLLIPDSGKIFLGDLEIQGLSEKKFRPLRSRIQMVFQNPFDCLDPSRRVLSLLEEPLRLWKPDMKRKERMDRIVEITMECGLPMDSIKKWPSEFSGGQLQRISLARALLSQPQILIADEIISALDVPIQNQILSLLYRMKEDHDLTLLFITHDLSIAKKISDRIMVMRKGKIVDIGAAETVLDHTQIPYIRQLSQAVFTFAGKCAQA